MFDVARYCLNFTPQFCSLTKRGQWAVYLTLGSDRGWTDICDTSICSYSGKTTHVYLVGCDIVGYTPLTSVNHSSAV